MTLNLKKRIVASLILGLAWAHFAKAHGPRDVIGGASGAGASQSRAQ
jgi:hypothetical protein